MSGENVYEKGKREFGNEVGKYKWSVKIEVDKSGNKSMRKVL
jgi:hypothetical protein